MQLQLLRKSQGIEKSLNGMLDRSRTVQAYLNNVVVRQYQKAQIARWETENASEGTKWKPLNDAYAKRKRKKFASAPGGGNVMMIASGKLVNAATMRETAGVTKVVTNTGLRIAINLGEIPYAGYAADVRPFMSFGTETLKEMHRGLVRFITTGEMQWRAG